MDSVFLASKIYGDGYQLDGYEVAEFVDGYQYDSTTLSLYEAVRMERNLKKIDHLLQKASVRPQLLQQRGQPSPQASLYAAIMGKGRPSNETHVAHWTDLHTKYAAICDAIRALDGYQ